MPTGTRAAVQVRSASGSWTTLLRGKVGRGGAYRFKIRGSKPASYALYLLVSGDRTHATTRVQIGTLTVT
jgi:hypothetical protein